MSRRRRVGAMGRMIRGARGGPSCREPGLVFIEEGVQT
jgi:hypothetical protein